MVSERVSAVDLICMHADLLVHFHVNDLNF